MNCDNFPFAICDIDATGFFEVKAADGYEVDDFKLCKMQTRK